MSVQAKGNSGTGFLSGRNTNDGLTPIHGVAIGSNDVTRGHLSGERKLWTPEVLEGAAHTLEGKQIVVDHENRSAREVVGQITDSRFEEGVGVIYQGVVDDEELAQKIGHGWLEVSPRIIHSEEMEEEGDIKIPTEIFDFDNLSIVSRGAAGSNEINLGEHEELMSVEELQDAFPHEPDGGIAEFQRRVDVLRNESEELQRDLSKWMYDNPEGAQGSAEGMNCSGYHEHLIEGKTWYMPCRTHQDFLNSLSAAEENMDELSEGDTVEEQEVIESLSSLWEADEDDVEEIVELGKEDFDELVEVETEEEEVEENSAEETPGDESQHASEPHYIKRVLGMSGGDADR